MTKIFKSCNFALLAVFFLPFQLFSQSPARGNIYSSNNFEMVNAAVVMPNGNLHLAGNASNQTTSATPFNGILLEESATVAGSLPLQKKYGIGTSGLNIVSIDAHPTSGTTTMVGTLRPTGQTHDDGVFIQVHPNGNVLYTQLWNSTADEQPKKVKVLSDGSFAIVGKIITNGIAQSFITRIGAPNGFAPSFHRVIGTTTATGATADEAVAVEQLPNGNLLVAGITHQFSRTIQGSLYLAVLDLNGTLLEYHTYQIENTVLKPVVKDMTILGNGRIAIVGNTTDAAFPNKTNGFSMTVTPTLDAATFVEIVEAGTPDLSTSLNAVVAANGKYFVAGSIDVVNSNVVSKDALLMRFDNSLGFDLGKRINVSLNSDEELNDIVIRENGTIPVAVGFTSFSNFSGTFNRNILTIKTSLNLDFCVPSVPSLQFNSKLVRHITPVTQSSTTMVTSGGNATASALSLNSLFLCNVGKQADELPAAEPEEGIAIFPNPAQSSATLRLPTLTGTAQILISDATGKVVLQRETQEEETTLDLRGMAPGLYFVQVRGAGRPSSQKLIVE